MREHTREQFLKLVKTNIKEYGYHVTIVIGGNLPRYAYTIGLSDSLGFELVFAGGTYYMKEQVYAIFDGIVKSIEKDGTVIQSVVEIDQLGQFSFNRIDNSWSKLMMIGTLDYYKIKMLKAFQITPVSQYKTLDVPNMAEEWSENSEPIWQWLNKKWDYPIPVSSTVTTDIDALRGSPIKEVMRWEQDEWEMFSCSGPEVKKEDARVVPIGLILGLDPTLKVALDLEEEKGVWRENRNSKWNKWG